MATSMSTSKTGIAKPGRDASPAREAATQLTVTLGSSSFTLNAADLAKHPSSLLAGLAAEGSSSLDLSSVATDNPLAAWPEVLAAIPGLYRGAGFSVAFLQQALQHHPQESDATTTTNDEARCDALYARLQRLLSFLGLPGPVADWVRWETATPRQSKVLQFAFSCMVQPAVDVMMDFTPFAKKNGLPDRHAAFLLAPRDGVAPLAVYAVDTASLGISSLTDTPSTGILQLCFRDWPVADLSSPDKPRVNLSKHQVQDCISASNPVVGRQVQRALTGAAAAAGNAFEVQVVAVDWKALHHARGGCQVPMWVMRW